MAKSTVVMMLLLVSTVMWAQDDDATDQQDAENETRRPSWSSGMPEREKPESMDAPELNIKMEDRDIEMDMSEFGLERPKVEYNLPEESVTPEPVDETERAVNESVPEIVPTEQDQDTPVVTNSVTTEAEPIPDPEPVEPELVEVIPPPVYQWTVTNKTAVEFPAVAIRRQISGWVDVEVSLNPQGDVIGSEAIDYSANGRTFVDAAENNLRQWTFQPPQDQGVKELVSKVYRLEFKPPPPTSTEVEQPQVVEAEEPAPEGVTDSSYNWKIIDQKPLDYPMAAARNRLSGWVDLNVTINADGEVINIEEEKYSSRGKVFVDPAIESMQQWRFEPPKSQGIEQAVSRSYRIEFEL